MFSEEGGSPALHVLQTKICDWALLDIGLPDLDGMEVTRHCREWERINNKLHLPIFAITAHAKKKIKDQCKKVGFDDVLEKSFTEKDLKRIEKFLKTASILGLSQRTIKLHRANIIKKLQVPNITAAVTSSFQFSIHRNVDDLSLSLNTDQN